MRPLRGAAAVLAPIGLAACMSADGGAVLLVPSVSMSHFIALETDADGTPAAVADRSVAPELMTVLERRDGSARTAASAWVVGVLPGGTSIPSLDLLEPDGTRTDNPIRTVISRDGFLDQVADGGTFALGRYSTRARGRLFTGYRVVGDLPSAKPTSGTARYEGSAHALMFGSSTGAREVAGKATLDASFAADGGSVEGRLFDLAAGGQPVGYELALRPSAIGGVSFLGGRVEFQREGGGASGATMQASDWQGAFYGAGAASAAGTFSAGATGVPLPGGGTETVQGVGAFGGSR